MQALLTHGLARHVSSSSLLVLAVLGDALMVEALLEQIKAKGLLVEALWTAIAHNSANSDDPIPKSVACYWQTQTPDQQHLEVARLLVQQLPDLSSSDLDKLAETAAWSGSIIPVQLAAMGVQPQLRWAVTLCLLAEPWLKLAIPISHMTSRRYSCMVYLMKGTASSASKLLGQQES